MALNVSLQKFEGPLEGDMIDVAIGPLLGEYGGPSQQIINIIKHSKHRCKAIRPHPLSIYLSDNKFKVVARFLLRKCGMKRADICGLYFSKVLSSRFDIVHLQTNSVLWPEIFYKTKNRHAKYIQTCHGVHHKEDFLKDWHFRRWLNDLLLESCRESDGVISVARWIQEMLFEENIESFYVPNGVSVSEFEAADPLRFKGKYGIGKDFFLFVASIQKYKRPELFVELARKMADKLFVLVGRKVTLNNLRAYMNAPVPENIKCLGVLPRRDVVDAFAACKVFVLPSKNEAFGIVLLEAMACRKPVVAANNAGPKEIVTLGRDGFLFEPDNITDLYEKACKAWEHPEVGERGYKKVKEKFDWPIIIKQIDKVYEDLAGP